MTGWNDKLNEIEVKQRKNEMRYIKIHIPV